MGSHFIGVFTGLVVCSIIILMQLPTSSAAQLPCTHLLRNRFPHLFAHCDSVCRYTSWSSWRRVPNCEASVPTHQCPSGEAYTEERTRTATGSGCTGPLRETQRVCLPTQEERLIIGLGLGTPRSLAGPLPDTNARISPNSIIVPSIPSTPSPLSRRTRSPKCPQYGTNGQICENIPGIGKRSTKYDKREVTNNCDNHDTPIPFDWDEHAPRLRSRRQTSCGDQTTQTQYVLFVLDTSGSITAGQFDRMKVALARLPALFCKQVKFAVITFNQYVNLEFCFDCFESTFDGRTGVENAIKDIVYRSGQTHTGHAAKCVCNEVLHSSCGISYPLNDATIDVVFITDGQSNDPNLEVCNEISCLHNRFGINVHAIGINNYNQDELDCIADNDNILSVFKYESFDNFERAIEKLEKDLLNALSNSIYSCARLDATISPTGTPPFICG